MNPLRKKIFADIGQEKGRIALAWLAFLVSSIGTFLMLNSYAVLKREVQRNYALTTPAHATFEIDHVSKSLESAVANRPEVENTERRRSLSIRVKDGEDWRLMRLFVIDDFNNLRLNTFRSLSENAILQRGEILLERSALRLSNYEIGETLSIKIPGENPSTVKVAGWTHDAGLSPSDQERTLFAYATSQTFQDLGGPAGFDELLVRYSLDDPSRSEIETASQVIGLWIQEQGITSHEIRIPPPGRHPHQGPMEAVLSSFIGFGFLALFLSAILISTTFNALFAKQTRQLAIIKTLGATPSQLRREYLLFVLAGAIVTTFISMPLAFFASQPFTQTIAQLINFDLYDSSIPHAILFSQIAIGLLIPLLATYRIVNRASKIQIREGLSDSGTNPNSFRAFEFIRNLIPNPQMLLSISYVLNRPKRLLLALLLIASSSAIFLSAFNMRESWTHMVSRVYSDRDYHIELKLSHPYSESLIRNSLQKSGAIDYFEAWGSLPTHFHQENKFATTSVYPDGGHGSFTLHALPPLTQLIDFPITEGRWLQQSDSTALVLNQGARAARPGTKIGDLIKLQCDGTLIRATVLGFVEEVGSDAAAYLPRSALPANLIANEQANLLRIKLLPKLAKQRSQAISDIERILANDGIEVSVGIPLAELQTAMNAHVGVLLASLISAASIIGIVSIFGLSSLFSISVIERKQEFATLRAIGLTPSSITRMVLFEGFFIASLSFLLALPLTIALSSGLNRIVGLSAFQVSLPLSISTSGLAISAIGSLAIILLACFIPAREASKQSVHKLSIA